MCTNHHSTALYTGLTQYTTEERPIVVRRFPGEDARLLAAFVASMHRSSLLPVSQARGYGNDIVLASVRVSCLEEHRQGVSSFCTSYRQGDDDCSLVASRSEEVCLANGFRGSDLTR